MATFTLVSGLLSAVQIRPTDEYPEAAVSRGTSVSTDARISVFPMGDDHPIAHLFGKYADDPLWQELEEIMERNRASDNADDE